jgi:hypothetical protein
LVINTGCLIAFLRNHFLLSDIFHASCRTCIKISVMVLRLLT